MPRNRSLVRVLSLLRLLEGRRRWSLIELAVQFDVSTKTARRDLRALEEAGYPVTQTPIDGRGMRRGESRWWLA
jgi:predicted DNA-binding transcriptional regulator YafY